MYDDVNILSIEDKIKEVMEKIFKNVCNIKRIALYLSQNINNLFVRNKILI